MGQGQSSSGKEEDVSMYPEDVQETHHKVVALRKKLALLKVEGKANKKKRRKEIKSLEKEKMELHVTLMKLGKHAQRHFSFWEYVRIIRSTFSSVKVTPQIQQGSSISLSKEKPKTTAMVKQSDAVQYTIFAFYEAYLLKKLHVAMMLKTQKKLHAKGWNDMVMYLYYEIPKIQSSFEKAEAKLVNQQQEEEGQRSHVEELYMAHIENQKSLMVALQEGVEGKVRTAPEGTQYSFKKKKSTDRLEGSEGDDGSSGSFRSKENSSSRSIGSTGTGSGSFRQKQVRSSVYGPAYEAGSSKTEAYQALWMKNSRNKFAKTIEKAQAPIEEESKPAPAPAPASSDRPFASRAAKFQSRFKKEETPKEEIPKEEPRSARFQSKFKKFQSKQEEAPKEEPPKEEEPVKEEPPKEEESPKEEPKEEEPLKEEPKEEEPVVEEPVVEEPVKEEPKEEPVDALPSDDEVELNEPEPEPVKPSSEKSPVETEESTEFTAKSSVGEEDQPVKKKKKKKKKNQLPGGIPETLEIDTSDDDMSLDGDTAPDPTKKKKKKKKKKITGAESGDDADGEIVKKKKKKKKKAGVSSNSSVVSELSNGSSLPH